jgi:archaemetzincin
VKPVYVLPIGEVEEAFLGAMEHCLRRTYQLEAVRLPAFPEPRDAFDGVRGQFGAIPILHKLVAACPPDAVRLLGITECDLFIPMLSFIYGQAQLSGRVALLSIARLKQEFYGLPADRTITVERTVKETLHELGHTFGLTHCLDKGCPMALSTTIQQLDGPTAVYCPGCTIMLRELLHYEVALAHPGR